MQPLQASLCHSSQDRNVKTVLQTETTWQAAQPLPSVSEKLVLAVIRRRKPLRDPLALPGYACIYRSSQLNVRLYR